MSESRKVVLIASGSSPDRAIALERLLASAADRTGWSDRLEIRLGGIDGGAGRLSDVGRSALGGVGLEADATVCPDLARRPELLEGAAVVVCDRGEVADALIDWDEAGEAEFVCMDDLEWRSGAEAAERRGAEADEKERLDLAIADEVERYVGEIDEVLRRIVRAAPAA